MLLMLTLSEPSYYRMGKRFDDAMRYIGSKNRILDFIDKTILETYGDYSNATVADLFSGTGCVGEMFKKKGARVISNDYMHFSYAMQISRVM